MEFEFDLRKSAANARKHGIDFVKAQALWDDPARVEIPARTSDEPRTLIVGKIGSTPWAAVITQRRGRLRLISVRRARKEEVVLYESEGIRPEI